MRLLPRMKIVLAKLKANSMQINNNLDLFSMVMHLYVHACRPLDEFGIPYHHTSEKWVCSSKGISHLSE